MKFKLFALFCTGILLYNIAHAQDKDSLFLFEERASYIRPHEKQTTEKEEKPFFKTVSFNLHSDFKKSLSPQKDSINLKKRQWLVGSINVAAYGGSLVVLNNAWYSKEPRSSFHFYDDSKEWQQIDKVGHAWTAYNTGKASIELWKWAGLPHKKAVWIGGISGALYLTTIETLDGFSSKWGWSWSDIGANFFGSGLLMSQELLWGEQRIQFKFSFHQKGYKNPVLKERANDLYGSSWYERMLKDYNAQTYWLSVNLKSFMPDSKWPAWLNVAAGYGANGMYGGYNNIWKDEQDNVINRTDIARVREYYLSPDIDFTKIKTNSKFLKTTFTVLNAFKLPAPTLMLNSKGKLKFYPIYF